MPTVMQAWTQEISMMQQSVLITSCRGPDTLDKNHVAKLLCRWLRRCFLLSAFDKVVLPRPYSGGGGSFTGPSIALPQFLSTKSSSDDDFAFKAMQNVARDYMKSVDEVPHHFHLHLMHSAEILGYKHLDSWTRSWWNWFYNALVNDMHLLPETEEAMDIRLGDSEPAWHAAEEVTADQPQ